MNRTEDTSPNGNAKPADGLTALGFSGASANDPEFSRRPITTAIDELADQLFSAAAGQQALVLYEPRLTNTELVELMFDLAHAPDDGPNAEVLHQGFARGKSRLHGVSAY